MRAKNVVVVGMPRSGTSLTMGVFARQGYYVGPIEGARLREGDEHNPFGYFEADALKNSNVRIFARAGFPYHNTWTFERITPDRLARIRSLPPTPEDRELIQAYRKGPLWALKDPRLTYTLGYWWPQLDPERDVVVLTRRDPDAVVESFRRMGWVVQPDLRDRVDEHWQAAYQVIRDLSIPHALVNYSDYLDKPAEVAETLGALVGRDLTVDDLNVRPELNHSAGPRGLREFAHRQALRLPLPVRRWIRRKVPRRALEWMVPEWKYVAKSDDDRTKRGTPAPLR